MRLEHEFRVPAPLPTVWTAVLDPATVAPCMPGATLTAVEGDTFTGTVKVKLGPISLTYKGKGEFVERDETARRVVIKASGRDAQGNGTASAAVTLTLTQDGGETVGTVETDLSITGKPAQFGRGLIAEVGGKILDSFAACLSRTLAPPAKAPPAPRTPADDSSALPNGNGSASPTPDPPPTNGAPAGRDSPPTASESRAGDEADPIDLMELAGSSLAKRAVPVVAAVALVVVIVAVLRRGRK